MKYYEFGNGDRMPMLGLGTWQMLEGTAQPAVRSAIDAGYRHIDCAWVYQNESEIGQALQSSFDDGIVGRDEMWITTKLWNDRHRGEHVAEALKQQLLDLRLDYVDMYLIHWPVAHQYMVARPETAEQFIGLEEIPLHETWQAMLDCVPAGLCKHVGVANFSSKKIDSLIESTGIAPECNQVEAHPLLQQRELFEYCDRNNIAFVAYSPLGSGGRPDMLKKEDEPNLLALPIVQEIAEDRGISPAQVLLAWAIKRGTAAIPKSTNPDRQKENLEAVGIGLSEAEMDQLAALDDGYRYVDGSFWEREGGPYTVSNLWDE